MEKRNLFSDRGVEQSPLQTAWRATLECILRTEKQGAEEVLSVSRPPRAWAASVDTCHRRTRLAREPKHTCGSRERVPAVCAADGCWTSLDET